MKAAFLFVAAFVALSAHAAGTSDLPPEVQSFIADRKVCDHFAGEIDGHPAVDDEHRARKAFVSESIEIYCAGTDRRLAALRRRYQDKKNVIESLKNFESHTEGSPCWK